MLVTKDFQNFYFYTVASRETYTRKDVYSQSWLLQKLYRDMLAKSNIKFYEIWDIHS